MANKKLVVEKGEKYENKVSELDKARRDYDKDYTLEELAGDEEVYEGNAIRLSDIVQFSNGNYGMFLEFIKDDEKEKISQIVGTKFKSDVILVTPSSELFQLVQLIEDDTESGYFKVDLKALQEVLKNVTSFRISAKEVTESNGYEHVLPVIESIEGL